MVLLAALLRNYPRGKCLIDIGTEGIGSKGVSKSVRIGTQDLTAQAMMAEQ